MRHVGQEPEQAAGLTAEYVVMFLSGLVTDQMYFVKLIYSMFTSNANADIGIRLDFTNRGCSG